MRKVIFLDIDGEWLTKHGKNVSHYVIIDDMDNMLQEQQPHFVWIDPEVGITEGNAIQAIMILNHLNQSKRNMKKLLILMIILCFGLGANAQTIRNANSSMLATINSNGEVRNSNNSLVGKISQNGEIRDSNNHYLGKIDGRTVRNSNNSTLGYIDSDGIVRNSNNSLLGRVYDDGTVRDSNSHCIGYARGVPRSYAALFFFFSFF